jgi:hypothetical protein
VTLATHRAAREDVFIPDAQQGVEFAVDADVDVLLRAGAGEMQPFHAGLHVLETAPMGGADCTLFGALEWPNSDLTLDPGSQSGERLKDLDKPG